MLWLRTFFLFSLMVHIASPSLVAEDLSFGDLKAERIKELSNREIAVRGKLSFDGSLSQTDWNTCMPQGSIAFPEELPEDFAKRIFKEDELEDLMKCKPGDCAFKFLTHERKKLEKLEGEEAHKQAYWQFYKDRKNRKTDINHSNLPLMLRSRDNAFSICQSDELNELIDRRPLDGFEYRVEIDDRDSRTRPTTRLVQSYRFVNPRKKEICYAEVLVFADHYDLDRVEAWSLRPGLITLEVRHRLDFLHSWLRRLRKPELRKMLEEWAEEELNSLKSCLKSQ